MSACKANRRNFLFELNSRELHHHSSLNTPTPEVYFLYLPKEAMCTISYSLMVTPDGLLYTSYLIWNTRHASPPTCPTNQKWIRDNTTSSVFSAIIADENMTIGSSGCSWPHVVQPSRSVRPMPTIRMEWWKEWFLRLPRNQELWYLSPTHHASSGGKRSTLQYTSINACQKKCSPKETIAKDIKLLTKLHTRCCMHMINLNMISRLMIPHEKKSVTKHHSIICPGVDATSADSSLRSRPQTRSLELDQKHVWWSVTSTTQRSYGEFGIQSATR